MLFNLTRHLKKKNKLQLKNIKDRGMLSHNSHMAKISKQIQPWYNPAPCQTILAIAFLKMQFRAGVSLVNKPASPIAFWSSQSTPSSIETFCCIESTMTLIQRKNRSRQKSRTSELRRQRMKMNGQTKMVRMKSNLKKLVEGITRMTQYCMNRRACETDGASMPS